MIYFSDFNAPGGAEISFVGSATLPDNDAGTFNFSSLLDEAGGTPTVLENDVVFAAFSAGATADLAESGMKPSTATYTNLVDIVSGTNPVANLLVSAKRMGSTPDTSFDYNAVGGLSSGRSIIVHVLRGVNTSTLLDVAATTATGTGTGVADPPSITPSTAGAWIYVAGCYAEVGDRIAFTNPGDLSAVTNHFQAVIGEDATRDTSLAVGLKTDWASGAFDPAAFGGGSTDAAAAWAAASIAVRPA